MLAKVDEANERESALVDQSPAAINTRSTYRVAKLVAMVVAMEQAREMLSQPVEMLSVLPTRFAFVLRGGGCTRYDHASTARDFIGEVSGEGVADECYGVDGYRLSNNSQPGKEKGWQEKTMYCALFAS